jgi:hypothetical protein
MTTVKSAYETLADRLHAADIGFGDQQADQAKQRADDVAQQAWQSWRDLADAGYSYLDEESQVRRDYVVDNADAAYRQAVGHDDTGAPYGCNGPGSFGWLE